MLYLTFNRITHVLSQMRAIRIVSETANATGLRRSPFVGFPRVRIIMRQRALYRQNSVIDRVRISDLSVSRITATKKNNKLAYLYLSVEAVTTRESQ